MSEWNGYIDGLRVDVVDGGFAAGHPDFAGIVFDECGLRAAWRLLAILTAERGNK